MKAAIRRWIVIYMLTVFAITGVALSEGDTTGTATVSDKFSQYYENKVGFVFHISDFLGVYLDNSSTITLGMPIATVERDHYVVNLKEVYCHEDLVCANVEFVLKSENGILRPYQTMFEYDMYHTPLTDYTCPVYFCHMQVDSDQIATAGSGLGIGLSADGKTLNIIEELMDYRSYLEGERQNEYQMLKFYIEVAMLADGHTTSDVIEFSVAFPTMTLIQAEPSPNYIGI